MKRQSAAFIACVLAGALLNSPAVCDAPADLTIHANGMMIVHNHVVLNAGTFKVETNGTLSIDLPGQITSTSAVYGGALQVNDTGQSLVAGASFKLFDAGSYSGAFDTIGLPTLPAGLIWDTSFLATDGTVRIVSNFQSAPLANPNPGIVDLDVDFTAYPVSPSVVVTWDFGDGSPVATGVEVSHIYTVAGMYTVAVTGTTTQFTTVQMFSLTINNAGVLPGTNLAPLKKGVIYLRQKYDTVQLQTILHMTAGIDVTASPVEFSINGLQREFLFDFRGQLVDKSSPTHLIFRKNGGVIQTQNANLVVSLRGTGFKALLAAGAAVDANGLPLKLLVTTDFEGTKTSAIVPSNFKKLGVNFRSTFSFSPP